MGPTWVLSAPDGPRVGPLNHAIRVGILVSWFSTKTPPCQYGNSYHKDETAMSLMFIMWIPIRVRHLYIELVPWIYYRHFMGNCKKWFSNVKFDMCREICKSCRVKYVNTTAVLYFVTSAGYVSTSVGVSVSLSVRPSVCLLVSKIIGKRLDSFS